MPARACNAMVPPGGADDWRPTASWDALRLRAGLLAKVRNFFESRDFLEVETPLLSADVVVDRHLDPLAVDVPAFGGSCPRRMWLQTSPEFGMKRLMAAGGRAIYQVTRAFRSGEQGALHNPEFTIVEWYRRDDDMAAGIKLLSDLCQHLLGTGPAEELSYTQAFQRHAGLDPLQASVDELAAVARARNVVVPAGLRSAGQHSAGQVPSGQVPSDRDHWLDLLLVELVQPHLGLDSPVIIFDYPASQAALSRIRQGNPPVAERFELFVRGVELANGYHELLDPAELAQRNRAANATRMADGKEPLPEESRLLAAMRAGQPACTGAALGFDRVVMLAAGGTSLADVMAFPVERA